MRAMLGGNAGQGKARPYAGPTSGPRRRSNPGPLPPPVLDELEPMLRIAPHQPVHQVLHRVWLTELVQSPPCFATEKRESGLFVKQVR